MNSLRVNSGILSDKDLLYARNRLITVFELTLCRYSNKVECCYAAASVGVRNTQPRVWEEESVDCNRSTVT